MILKDSYLKYLAAILMLIDHIGATIYPSVPLRIIGRLSLPFFIYFLIQGERYTSDFNGYFYRLLMFGSFSQISYSLLFKVPVANILFGLSLSLLALRIDRPYFWILSAATAELLKFDYGYYGIFLTLLMKNLLFGRAYFTLTCIGLVVLNFLTRVFPFQFFSLFSVFFIYRIRDYRFSHARERWFYWFYPVHLLALLLIRASLARG